MNSHINSQISSTVNTRTFLWINKFLNFYTETKLKRPPQFYDSTKAIYYSKFNELCVNLLAKPNSKLNEITGRYFLIKKSKFKYIKI